MTNITRDDVLHLAQLSNLQLVDDEVDALQQNIGDILGYVDQLGELDTSGVEPTYQVTGLENVNRDDTVMTSDVSREELLALAPEQHDGQVPPSRRAVCRKGQLFGVWRAVNSSEPHARELSGAPASDGCRKA